jgi:hypothetical protein
LLASARVSDRRFYFAQITVNTMLYNFDFGDAYACFAFMLRSYFVLYKEVVWNVKM